MADTNKINVVLDEEALEILGAVSPELRNSAIIVALKMFKNSSIYKKYFCTTEECREARSGQSDEEDDSIALDDLQKLNPKKESQALVRDKPASPAEEPIITFDSF